MQIESFKQFQDENMLLIVCDNRSGQDRHPPRSIVGLEGASILFLMQNGSEI
jgi:hypothetical protein